MTGPSPLAVPGMRVLRERDGSPWSALVVSVDRVSHGDDEERREVYGLHEASATFGWCPIESWPGRWFVRAMTPDELVVGDGQHAGQTALEALAAAIKRYRLGAEAESVTLQAKMRGDR